MPMIHEPGLFVCVPGAEVTSGSPRGTVTIAHWLGTDGCMYRKFDSARREAESVILPPHDEATRRFSTSWPRFLNRETKAASHRAHGTSASVLGPGRGVNGTLLLGGRRPGSTLLK